MAVNFKKEFKTEVGDLQFSFSRIFTRTGIRYHISVLDLNSHPHFFDMEAMDAKWYIVTTHNLPSWIIDLENDFSEAIIERKPEMD